MHCSDDQGIAQWLVNTWGGGGLRPQKVCVPEIAIHSLAPSINFIFPLRKSFSDLVGGWVGKNPWKARIAPPPPSPQVSLSNHLITTS